MLHLHIYAHSLHNRTYDKLKFLSYAFMLIVVRTCFHFINEIAEVDSLESHKIKHLESPRKCPIA